MGRIKGVPTVKDKKFHLCPVCDNFVMMKRDGRFYEHRVDTGVALFGNERHCGIPCPNGNKPFTEEK